ncbi:hypothetical protein [Chitinophaga sp.]|uniref:hypothetical protein n=1 Tax=Chitinophaga sp. TaxID=1869181 RepID=UPI0031D0D01F
MHNNTETLLSNFDETAYVSVNSFYTQFCSSIKHIDRRKNENTVQLWVGQYTDSLKQSLESKAFEYLSRNRDLPTIDWFQKKLMYMIRLHLQEFLQRVRYV